MKIQGSNITKWILFAFFLGCALFLQQYSLYVIFNLKFEFFPIFYLLALRLFGFKKSLIAVIAINIVGYFQGIDSYFLQLSIVEVIFVGVLYRWKGRNLLTWDILFWSIISITFYCISFISSDITIDNIITLILIQVLINAMINALTADILADYLPRIPSLRKILHTNEKINFGSIISQIIIVAAIVPMFTFTIVNGWYEWNETLKTNTSDILSATDRIEEKIDAMDRQEIQSFKLESIVQKAYFKEIFDDITHQSNMLIYAVDNQNEILVSSGVDHQPGDLFQLFNNSFYSKLNTQLNVLLPHEKNNNLRDWSNGHFYSEFSIQNTRIFIIIPIEEQLHTIADDFLTYFKTIIVLFILALSFAWVCKRILTGSLVKLTKLTSDLPSRMEKNEDLYYSGSQIYEFSFLASNIEKVAKTLKEMFQKSKKTNELLTKRTQELVASKDELYQLAHFDGLTQLPNRYSFHEDLKSNIADYAQNQAIFAIVFIDLDKFKQVNDKIGHRGGDKLLQIIAERLMKNTNFEKNAKAYRLGGDEFVIIISDTNYNETKEFCSNLMSQIKAPLEIQGEPLIVSASMGVSFYPMDGEDIDKIINNADTAMYQSKEAGRDGVRFYKGEEDD